MIRFAAGIPGRTALVAALGLVFGAGPVPLPLAFGIAPAMAQGNLFAPVAYVNERAVTGYEVDQRLRFLTLLNQPGDLPKLALDGLIDDRLRVNAAKQVGLVLSPADIERGMTEFASRANLTAEQFVAALAQGGVSAETFRDFVAAQLTWRELIRAKYINTVTITDLEVDRALAAMETTPAVRVLMSELVIPVQGDPADELALARQLKSEISTEAAFAAAARRHSASESAGRGGKLDWMPVANLPPAVASMVMGLAPGQVSNPIEAPGAVVIFQMRSLSDAQGTARGSQTVEYAQYLIPDGPEAGAEVAAMRARVDSCIDLMAQVRDLPADRLLHDTKPLSEVPSDIGLELAKLDPGESSSALRRGGWRVFLMLCGRNTMAKDAPARAEVRQQLLNQRLSSMADIWLEQLRSEAIIRRP